MSTLVLTDAKIYSGEYDLSGDMNHVEIKIAADMLEDTPFGAAYHTNKAGLKKIALHAEGFTQFGTGQTTIDGRMRQRLAQQDIPFSVAPQSGNAGGVGHFFQSVQSLYNQGAPIGQLLKFQIDAAASGVNVALVNGTILEDGKTARTIAGNSNTQALGAISATQKLYGVLHLLAFTGTNVTFAVKSAVTDFATITQRAAFTANTTVGSQYLTPVAGAITDTFWRVFWTGTFTSFNAVLILGIQ